MATVVLLAAWMGVSARETERPILAIGLSLCSLGTLAGLRRAPVLALAGSLAAPLVVGLVGGSNGSDDVFLVLIVVSSYAVGRYASERHQPYIVAAVLGLTSVNAFAPGPFVLPQQLVFPVLATGAPWALGLAVRRAADRESRAVEFASDLVEVHRIDLHEATVQERLRVARELHDVTAHTMSVVSLLAQVLRRRIENGEEVTIEDAAAVEDSAKQAMRELRAMVTVLRPASDEPSPVPEPSIEQLPALAEECRRMGQTVELAVEGSSQPISNDLSLAAYRIVQECFTNARRHGADQLVRVALRWGPEHVELVSTNACQPVGHQADFVPGVGITGIRERVSLFGGELEVGPVHPATWVVRARLPITRRPRLPIAERP